MATPPVIHVPTEARVYHERIAEALDKAYDRALAEEGRGIAPLRELDVDSARVIIFSDQHKGARNRADDFERCEQAYNAALAFYFASGHTLIELGDVEELWEERAPSVIKHYTHTLKLSAAFHGNGRYVRVWGNHDDAWRDELPVRMHLHDVYDSRLIVREGLRFRVVKKGAVLGHLFLVHGHQGTIESDRLNGLARIPVRFVWRPLQRLFGLSVNTPATDWALRQAHNIAMHAWADAAPRRARTKIVLITGHTHRPVFLSKTLAEKLEEKLDAARREAHDKPADLARRATVTDLTAELEWVRGQGRGDKGPEGLTTSSPKTPCYFNTGCCCFSDGDVTGIEIAEGEIRLVRWPDDNGRPHAKVLEARRLEDVFAAVNAP
jgi:hypothetical protein